MTPWAGNTGFRKAGQISSPVDFTCPRQRLTGEFPVPADQVIYKRARTEAADRECHHCQEEDSLNHVGCNIESKIQKQCACEGKGSGHRLCCPPGRRGKADAKSVWLSTGSAVVQRVEWIESRDQGAPEKNGGESGENPRALNKKSNDDPDEYDPRLELQRGILARAGDKRGILKSLLKNEIVLGRSPHRSRIPHQPKNYATRCTYFKRLGSRCVVTVK